ncbi:FAD-binding oxidoreductase [bacterium]|nr:FAD-binding oxidoreductase [bacterium]
MNHTIGKTPLVLTDVSRLNPINVATIYQPKTESELVSIVKLAKEQTKKISISGSKHSQGGHIGYPDSLHINMSLFDEIISIDVERKVAAVQSGVTWEVLQQKLNKVGLAVKVMQSSGIFTVGGSLSVNCHGRDPRFGTISETVESFRLLTADGKIISVSKKLTPDLFNAVIGGYGLFGIIVDVELSLIENELYVRNYQSISIEDYETFIEKSVVANFNLGIHYGRLSIEPNTLLKDMHMVNYLKNHDDLKDTTKKISTSLDSPEQEKSLFLNRLFFNLSRHSAFGKWVRWKLQCIMENKSGKKANNFIFRNNAMQPPVRFLTYLNEEDSDILQEYFVPVQNFSEFVSELRTLVIKNNINLLSVTTRYLPEPINNSSLLSYTRGSMISVVLYINQRHDKESLDKAKQWTQSLVNSALKYDGTYYLTYQNYPSLSQFKDTYPDWQTFKTKKETIDPKNTFLNEFYVRYF